MNSCFKETKSLFWLIAIVSVLVWQPPVLAGNYEILHESLDANRRGYTVIRVWGTSYEIGEALGQALAPDIIAGVAEVEASLGSQYPALRAFMSSFDWRPQSILDELGGMAAGVQSVVPGATVDAVDLQVLNTYCDWAYACRAHSAWGRWVTPPVRTLSTRRLDYSTVFDLLFHHVVVAFDPSNGEPRWVSVAAPGAIVASTAVNQFGTAVSIHDFNSHFDSTAHGVSRGLASRWILLEMGNRPVSEHLAWAQTELGAMTVSTSGFINYFVPEGGGVFTCASGGSCDVRLPQADLFNGEVLITTNSQTDGHTVPSGGEFLEQYYQQGAPKDLKSHFEVMGTGGVHLVSVAFRGEEDMTIWVLGRGRSDRLELEWRDLFAAGPLPDGSDGGGDSDIGWEPDGGGEPNGEGDPGSEGALESHDSWTDTIDPQTELDSGTSDGKEASSGCGCHIPPGPARTINGAWMVVAMSYGIWSRRRRSR